jgi:hypothetical protein
LVAGLGASLECGRRRSLLPVQGGSIFAQYVPRLAAGTPARCTSGSDQKCTVDYPMSVFNPVPYSDSLQVGIGLRTDSPF